MAATFTATTEVTGTDSTTNETYSLDNVATVSSMGSFDKRYLTATTTVRNIIGFGASVEKGTFTALSGLCIINRGTDTGGVRIGMISGTDTAYILLGPGQCFFLWNRNLDTNTAGGAFSAFVSITDISVQAASGTSGVEYLLMHT